MPLRSLFLDFNAYFASCEQHLQPALRGRPIVVSPVQAPNGCCIAVSYAARAYGIRVGMRVHEAEALCPGVAIVPSRPEQYIELHHELRRIINDCMYIERVWSIDEMCCPLTGRWREPARALALARKIKARLAAFSPALTCSIGLAPNGWLAKVATEMEKPDGLVLLRDEDLPQALYGLELTDLTMIGRGMAARLQRNGIHTVAQLCALPRQRLRDIWGGVEGERFYLRLHGHVVPDQVTRRNHIGHSRVLPPERRDATGVRATAFRLLQRAAIRLRSEGFYAGRLLFSVDFYNAPPWEGQLQFLPTAHTPRLIVALQILWERLPQTRFHSDARHCGIVLGALETRESYVGTLFTEEEARGDALCAAIDRVTRRYGQRSLYFGCAHGGFDDETAVRIAFQRVPDLKVEN